ncbi:leukocyte immunoglobulin-like receptor subfamily A member 6 [Mauremys reevesii]|uniref:leukocyte immunoglobulin-like receptor subfamily A member 6 n=1 Tax=Mauremys reevesii TaxID=260615 RepID=UPI0019400C35|nr:leukocyte immunoglobulin-like receptor subfamily A member 6 [Mauremys reevesii]
MGGNFTIRCRHQLLDKRFLLYKDGAGNYTAYTDPAGSEAEFPIISARRKHRGSYTCRYSDRTDPPAYSEPSDPVKIIVREPSYPKPNISLRPSGGVSLGGAVAIWCRGQHQGVWFVLNKERRHFPPVDSDGLEAEFPISNVSREDGGNYSCFYHSRSEPFNVSYPSDPVELVVRDPSLPRPNISLSSEHTGELAQDKGSWDAGSARGRAAIAWGNNQGGAQDPTCSGNTGPGGSELKLCIPIIAGVSSAAAGLLLLVAFLCYRRTQGGKGPAPKQSRKSEPATTVYALRGEGTQLDVLPREPDPSAEGLTYAELDRQALQAKRGGPAPAPEPVLYATINVS